MGLDVRGQKRNEDGTQCGEDCLGECRCCNRATAEKRYKMADMVRKAGIMFIVDKPRKME